MPAPFSLRTERLELSVPTAEDVDTLTEECQDEQIRRWTTVPSPYRREHAEEFVRHAAKAWRAGTAFEWAIRDEDGVGGMIGLARVSNGQAELGYWVAARARGRGYALEAGRTVVDAAFARFGLERLEWHAAAGNIASARLARSLGFRFEGVRRAGVRLGSQREDGWLAGLLATDDRTPHPWPVDLA